MFSRARARREGERRVEGPRLPREVLWASFVSAAAQFPVFGAVAVSLPGTLEVWSLSPAGWKREPRVHLQRKPKVASVVEGRLDACSVSHAAREINQRAVEAAA